MEEYYVGRNDNSCIKIDSIYQAVSGNHLRITIEDGIWLLDDLGSKNGTYLRDDNGNFKRVYHVRIKESDVIKLGNGGAYSFTFMAHRILNPSNYMYEFEQLNGILDKQIGKEEHMEKKIENHAWISRGASAFVSMLCAAWIWFSKSSSPEMNCIRIIAVGFLPAIISFFFRGDKKKFRKVREQRVGLLICPKCGSPISEYDIRQRKCSRCKAM